MSYFAWKGIDITGAIHKGYLSAYNKEQLITRLQDRHIALLSCRAARRWHFKKSNLIADRVHLFNTLALLHSSGVPLAYALILAADQMKNGHLQDALVTISGKLYEGMSLGDGFAHYTLFFNPLAVQLLKAGEESGNLSESCKAIAQYNHMMNENYRRLRSALLMPAITLIFFIGITIFIIAIIVPRFALLYQSMHQELPWFTQLLYRMSQLMHSWLIMPVTIVFALSTYLIITIGKRQFTAAAIERIGLCIPVVRGAMLMYMKNYFFSACALLMQGGIPLMQALECIRQASSSFFMRKSVDNFIKEVTEGNSLSSALLSADSQFFDPESIAIIQVGQESGKLGPACAILAQRYHELLTERIATFSALVHPCMIVCLGVLISCLLVALYVPLFSLSKYQGF